MRWTPEQAGVNCTLIFWKEDYSDFVIPFEIFSRLILVDSTTNQIRFFPGNPTPFGWRSNAGRSITHPPENEHQMGFDQKRGLGHGMRSWLTRPWNLHFFHYLSKRINVKCRDVCFTSGLGWCIRGWTIFLCTSQPRTDEITSLLSCQWFLSRESFVAPACSAIPNCPFECSLCFHSPILTAAKIPPLLEIFGRIFLSRA